MKNKKILGIVATSVILMSVFTGCGNSNNTSSTQNSSTAKSTTASTQSSGTQANANNQIKKMPDLAGEVSSVNGNQITLKLIELPTNAGKGKNTTSPSGQNSTQKTSQSNAQTPDSKSTNGHGSQRHKMQVKYTGETKTITISSGIPITTFSRNTNGGSQKTITVADIKTGDRLDIWYTDSTKSTISNIRVLGSASAQNQTQSQN
jgi:hypothetical protein